MSSKPSRWAACWRLGLHPAAEAGSAKSTMPTASGRVTVALGEKMALSSSGIRWMFSVGLLFVLAWLFSALTFHLVRDTSYFLLACIVAALFYPVCLGIARTGTGFWKGLSALLLILFLSQAFAAGVYFVKMNAVHRDEGESFAISLIYLAGSFAAAALFYPLGFWAPRWFRRGIHVR